VPAIVDLAAMRDAMVRMGGDPKRINPLLPAELVIDHSVQVDDFGSDLAFRRNADLEFERNRERYSFLRWARRRFAISRSCRPTRALCTKSIWNTSRGSSSSPQRPRVATRGLTRTPLWAPTRTRR